MILFLIYITVGIKEREDIFRRVVNLKITSISYFVNANRLDKRTYLRVRYIFKYEKNDVRPALRMTLIARDQSCSLGVDVILSCPRCVTKHVYGYAVRNVYIII